MRKGFTLAEVLVTLGIIGVVAGMTLPQLFVKYQKKVTVERLKMFYSEMLNVVRLSEAENGEMHTWNFPKRGYDPEIINFFRKYYLPYLKDVKEYTKPNNFVSLNYTLKYFNGTENRGNFFAGYLVKTKEGMYIYFLPNVPSKYIWMYVDINGHQKPNQIGYDIFVFDIYAYPSPNDRNLYKIKFWGQFSTSDNFDNLFVSGGYRCTKDSTSDFSGFYCGVAIMRSGWSIPANYPW